MNDKEKLEAIQKLVTTYPMNLQDTIKEIQKILGSPTSIYQK